MNRESEIINVRIDEIIPNRFQPRLTFNESELQSLAESIKMHGIIQPLVLRRIGEKFEIIAGERRYKASVMAGLTTVPAVIMNIDDQKSAEVAIVENLQRKNLTAIEEAQSYKKLLDKGYLTQEELANKMSVTQPTIANKLRLLNLTEAAQQALLKNQISERHARSLLAIANPNMQISMLNRIIGERLTVRQTDEEISKLLGRSPETINDAIENYGESSSGNSQVLTPEEPQNSVAPVVETIKTPTFDNLVQPTPTISSYINPAAFDVDIDSIKSNSVDIIPEHKPSDIDMLMRTESQESSNTAVEETPKKVSLEDVPTNIDMGSIVNSSNMAVNPFQNLETPETPFEIPTPTFEKPYSDPTPVSQPTYAPGSSLIDEFRQQQPKPLEQNIEKNSNTKSISSAITVARNEVRKIEDLGFQVDTEEFDFEDMYQIIIKIKKD